MRNKILLGIIATIAVVGLILAAVRGPKKEDTAALPAPIPTASQLGISKEVSPAKETLTTAALPAVAGPAVKGEKPAPLKEVPAPFAPELNRYIVIKNKVFMNDEEKALRKSFLQNNEMLSALGEFLKTPAAETKTLEAERNAATDLLLEAVKAGPNAAAEAALQGVIADGAVENPQLDQKARQSLAGIKAEVLYHWSAINPDKAPEMKSWLPGPVSAKIWQNVEHAQAQNVAESKAEAH
jgi:hypothetical protein